MTTKPSDAPSISPAKQKPAPPGRALPDGSAVDAVRSLEDLARSRSLRVLPVGPELSRILDRSGRVIGHLQTVTESRGLRYRVRRYHPAVRAFLDVGEFWSPADALDCLRFAR